MCHTVSYRINISINKRVHEDAVQRFLCINVGIYHSQLHPTEYPFVHRILVWLQIMFGIHDMCPTFVSHDDEILIKHSLVFGPIHVQSFPFTTHISHGRWLSQKGFHCCNGNLLLCCMLLLVLCQFWPRDACLQPKLALLLDHWDSCRSNIRGWIRDLLMHLSCTWRPT